MDCETEIFQSHEKLISAIITHGHSAVWTDTIIPLIGASGEKADLLVGFSQDDPGKVSYAQTAAHKYDSAKRTKTKFGRFLTRRLKIEVTPEMHTEIGAIMGEDSYSDKDFAVRSDVGEVYHELYRNHDLDSCMAPSENEGDDPNDCLSFYEENDIPVLVWKGRARALLFTILPSGKRFVDRIYPSDPDTIAAYEQWASVNDAHIRLHHSMDHGGTLLDGTPQKPMLSMAIDDSYVSVSHWDGAVPYVDTFAYLNRSEGRLYPSNAYGRVGLKETDGSDVEGENGAEDDGDSTCNECSNRFDSSCEGYVIDDEHYCESCGQNANHCNRCEEMTFSDCIEIEGEWFCDCCATDANTCERCEKNTFDAMEEIEVENGTEEWCEKCVNEDSYTCEKCDTMLSDEITAYPMLNGETVCGPCYTEMKSAWCPGCAHYVPGGVQVYSAQHGENTCPDCNAKNSFGCTRAIRVLGGTALAIVKI